jgi:hypothetical protein
MLYTVNLFSRGKTKKPKKSRLLGLGELPCQLVKLNSHDPRTGGMPSPGHHHAESPYIEAKLSLPVQHYFPPAIV